MPKQLPDTFQPDAFDLQVALDDGRHQDKVASLIAKHLRRSSRPLSQAFRNLVADWIERKPQPPVEGQKRKRKKEPTNWVEIGLEYLELRAAVGYDEAHKILAKRYGLSPKSNTIKKTVAFFRRAAKKLERPVQKLWQKR